MALPVRPLVRRLSLGVVALLQLGAAKCGMRAASTTASTVAATPRDSADQLLFGVRVMLASGGLTHGDLHADSAFKYDEGTRFELRGVTVTLLDTAALKAGTVTARTGLYTLKDSRLELHGHVQVTSKDGRRLEVERLVYDLPKNRFTSESAYVYTPFTGGKAQTGVGFNADPQLARVLPLKAEMAGGKGDAAKPVPKPASPKAVPPPTKP